MNINMQVLEKLNKMDRRDIQIQTEKFDGETISALPYKDREEHLKGFIFSFLKKILNALV